MADSCTAGTVTVRDSFSQSAVKVSACSVDDTDVTVNESVNVMFSVVNNNGVRARVDAYATVNGQKVTATARTGEIISANSFEDFTIRVPATMLPEGTQSVGAGIDNVTQA